MCERIISEVLGIPPIGSHHVDVPVRKLCGSEGNVLAIRRPGGKPIIVAILGEISRVLPIDVHHVDVPVSTPIGHKGNLRLCINAYHQRCQNQEDNASQNEMWTIAFPLHLLCPFLLK